MPPPPTNNSLKSKKDTTDSTIKIGIVIPIYNTPINYLKEAIESVLNQSFSDIEILLVNDGSSKNECLECAKEYALSDSRITLVSKSISEGASVARNIGIEYFAKQYSFKLKNKGELNTFTLNGKNPNLIECAFKRDCAISPLDITHIVFLDSDDVWSKDLLKECVKVAKGADIVWYADDKIVEDESLRFDWTLQSIFKYDTERAKVISAKDWLNRAIELNIREFWFAWQGLIDFKFLTSIGLKFIPRIQHEDINFGILLFAQARKIYVLPKKLMSYRIRANSTTGHTGILKEHIPFYFKGVFEVFNKNSLLTKSFYRNVSLAINYFYLLDFIEANPKHPSTKGLQEIFVPFYAQKYLDFLYFLNYIDEKFEVNFYFDVCFNVFFSILDEIPSKPFSSLEDPSVLKQHKRKVRFAKDLLFLENSHITNLQNSLAQAQRRIQELEMQISVLVR